MASYQGKVCMELGSGTGLAGIFMARAGVKRVFVTDIGEAVLQNCAYNIAANAAFIGQSRDAARVRAVFRGGSMPPLARSVGAMSGTGCLPRGPGA